MQRAFCFSDIPSDQLIIWMSMMCQVKGKRRMHNADLYQGASFLE